MRVVQLGPFPPPHGGVQTNLVAIRDYLRRLGHSCAVINLTRHRRQDGDDVYYPRTAAQLLTCMARLHADVFHLHLGGDLSFRLLGLTLVAALWPGRKAVLTFHSGGYPSSPAGRAARPFSLRGFIFRRLDGIIAVNPEIAGLFHRFGVLPARVRTILPYAVALPDTSAVLPVPLREFMAGHKPLLLTVGLLEPEYDLPLQIDALGAIRERFPGAGLLIAGAGSLQDSLRRYIAGKPYAAHVLLYGDVAHDVTLRVMLESDVLLRTTLYDGDSVSVREALCLGLPVIASDNRMRPPGVVLVPPSDLLALNEAVFRILDAAPAGRPPAAGDGRENIRAVVDFYSEVAGRLLA